MSHYTRKQLKEDRFAEATAETVHWAVAHRKTLIIIVAAVLVALIGGLAGWSYQQRKNSQASLEMGKAMRVYEAPLASDNQPVPPGTKTYPSGAERAKAAMAEFQRIRDSFPRTRQAEIAHYMVGITALEAGDTQRAESELKSVAGSRNNDLSALAKMALAAQYRSSKREQEAIALYKQLAEKPANSVPKATAQLELAATYEQTNNKAEAVKIYEEIRKVDEKSAAAQLAAAKLQELAPAPVAPKK